MASCESEAFSTLNSELAVRILDHIASEGNKDYGSNIADELDKSQTSICRILTDLHEIGFVRKTSKERAHYYSIDFESIAEFWLDSLVKGVKEVEGGEEWAEKLEENSEEPKKLLKSYLRKILSSEKNLEDRTLNEVLYDSFVCSLIHMLREDEKFFETRPGTLNAVIATAFVRNEEGYPEEMRQAIQEIE